MEFSIADFFARKRLDVPKAAKKAGMDEERLRELIGGAKPNLGEMRRLSDALKMPLSVLLGDGGPETYEILFRKNTPGPPQPIHGFGDDIAASVLSKSLGDILALVSDVPANLRWLGRFDGMDPVEENAESYAAKFRALLARDVSGEPIPELPDLVANKLNVFVIIRDYHEIEGASAIVNGHAFVFLCPRKFRPRMLFTLAHEVGHLVARSEERLGSFAVFDKKSEVQVLQRVRSDEERFANAFAIALLLPKTSTLRLISAIRAQHQLSGELGDIEIELVARFFGVSFEVAGRRCEDLGLLPRGGARTLYERVSTEYGSPERRAAEIGLPDRDDITFETSDILLQAAIGKIRNGEMSIGRAAETLNIPISLLVAKNAESL